MSDAAAVTALVDQPVYVVTAAAAGERAGCLVGFASQCSLRPVRFAVWLSRVNHTWRVADRASHLAVHLLAPDQLDLAHLFGGRTGDDLDKFASLRWHEGTGGAPVLTDALAWFVGAVGTRADGGDHEAFVLEPLEECRPAASGARALSPPRTPLTLSDTRTIAPGHP